ncbi:MAG: class III poly(R)-hydroxyalkanoic acid synthase subunit PhaC [Proteobacteria bacterium]|nr:class III poly(R)-hydroxyalkanoic acid synthase subunit PhaC [Pseudomonadota bacterium]MBU1583354.1 class III poly(R)-hydroxyalkanoic acid synthase subunit PhaC [Pseudomonadota bacterium]MBU2453138.1 class III poly(R)-hydroxyalkanoic acid synthase subunit PhaC [Pseudomonadota bacterium]MBU2627846.1 class III poly(R)-hydroxyalkanoic acid synthase subunit PhaC [Pseudomonadota bacterium]
MSRPKAFVDLMISKLVQDTEKAKVHIQETSGVLTGNLETDIATTPYEVVYEEDRVKLKHYKKTTETRLKTPLLIVYALVNRETMLDLQPGRSVVKSLLDEGINLYMIDWGYPTRKDRYLTIDDHVSGYIDNVIDHICSAENIEKVNLMGICMGGAFSLMYSALFPEKVKNLITVVTATDFDTNDGLLHIWSGGMDQDTLIDTYGNMPGDLLNLGFLMLNPARLMIDKYVGFMDNMNNKTFVENFLRMEKWIFDSPDVPGETFRQFIQDCYKKNLLIQNKMELDGKIVDLRKVTMPVLNIYGTYDHLVPAKACEKTTSAVGSKNTEDLVLDTGHIGIFVSSKSQKEFVPKISQWLIEWDDPEKHKAMCAARKLLKKKMIAKENGTVKVTDSAKCIINKKLAPGR